MSRLIDADAAVEKAIASDEIVGSSVWETSEVVEFLDDCPTIEAVPVVHGRWEDKPTGRYGKWQSWCSACGKHSGIGGIEKNRHRAFCPNCGARMDGDEK